METPLDSALALLRRAAVDAPAVMTVRQLLERAAADTSGTPRGVGSEEDAIGLLREPGNAEVLRAAAQRLHEVSAEAEERLVSLFTPDPSMVLQPPTLATFVRSTKEVHGFCVPPPPPPPP